MRRLEALRAEHGPPGAEAIREILTPEGVPLRFVLGRVGDRAAAFLVDVLLIGLVITVLTVLALLVLAGSWLAGGPRDGWLMAFVLLATFLVRNFYFVWFELRWQGCTPGKRWFRLRVVDSGGGPLTGEAVFVRNLTRDLEVFLPLTALAAPGQLWAAAPGWAQVLALGWLGAFALMPLLNRRRLRVGDLVAGTMVVRSPEALLLPDLSETSATGGSGPDYTFTNEQLELYGIYELQVLEDLLRMDGPERRAALETVCGKVRRKIGWEAGGAKVDPVRFLQEFYTAQRARLEHKLLFGQRQERKRSGRLGQPR
jgi:uncharacterized RDD family membrane protein YckC